MSQHRCDVCKIDLKKNTFDKHLKSTKHSDNMDIIIEQMKLGKLPKSNEVKTKKTSVDILTEFFPNAPAFSLHDVKNPMIIVDHLKDENSVSSKVEFISNQITKQYLKKTPSLQSIWYHSGSFVMCIRENKKTKRKLVSDSEFINDLLVKPYIKFLTDCVNIYCSDFHKNRLLFVKEVRDEMKDDVYTKLIIARVISESSFYRKVFDNLKKQFKFIPQNITIESDDDSDNDD